MFVNTIEFPPIKLEDDAKFREWFKWSNEMYQKFDGLISRKLLKRIKGGEQAYFTLVEHRNQTTFMNMHTSSERQQAFERLQPLLGNSGLKVQFFEVIEG